MYMKFQDEPTIFREFLDDTPRIRVIETLLECGDLDMSLNGIAYNAGISRITLFRLWPKFVKEGLVVNTRNIGNAKMFKLNKNNPKAKILMKLFIDIMKQASKEIKHEVRVRKK